jgi:tryptophan-rich sensory protein
MADRSPYALPAAAVTATAVLGGVGTAPGSRWYRSLDKPPWQPPGAVFGPVWTVLYALTAAAGGRVLARTGDSERGAYLRAYTGNLALNTAWTWIFFRARRPVPAAVEAVLLAASTADLARRSWARDRVAGVALLPYALWTAFAAVLTTAIARRNPRR